MAGVSTKEIRTRIRSMESTKQITRAMEMVASSKLRKAQLRIANARPYFETLKEAIDGIVGANRELASPYFGGRAGGGTLYIVIAGDRGLAGGYNSNILKMCHGQMGQDAAVLPIGKKALDYFGARGVQLHSKAYNKAEEVSVGDCFSMARSVCEAFRAGAFGRVCVGYTRFDSVLSQKPHCEQLLPLTAQAQQTGGSDIVYEPDSVTVFDAIVPEYLGGVIYGALCESRASEFAARRTAMDAATQNADEMIADLSLKFNQARQAAITQEITEIVAG